jgi:hypothetical protein
MMEGYEASMKAGKVQKSAHSSKELRPIETVLRQSVKRKREWRHLAQEQIEDVKPTIPLGEKFWSLSREERDEIERLFATVHWGGFVMLCCWAWGKRKSGSSAWWI